MRHVIGFVLAVVMAAVLFVGGGWGTARIDALQTAGTRLTSVPGLVALAALLGVGLLLGTLLVAPAVSPLAAGLPGLALLAWSGLLVISARRADRLMPLPLSDLATGFRSLLAGGVLAMLGAVMIVPLFVPSRWRRRLDTEDDFGPRTTTGLLQLAASPAAAC